MYGALALMILGFVTAGLSFAAFWKWRRWQMLSMSLGSIAIAVFYGIIAHNYIVPNVVENWQLVITSRVLWAFVLVNTAIMAVSDLLIKKINGTTK